ncbi:MAG: D-tyrosyl-tRNA(Tyr) deacylase [Rhodobacteraceae bacterium]|nr:D-tyrosyl-tRNA(Tyr) deacylase [Paracoccaceae bacterium]
MRILVQRVSEARVSVAGEVIGEIGAGLLILVCAMQADDKANAEKLAEKVAKLRIFRDADDKMNLSLKDTEGAALVISQFTLAADTTRGNRPGFSAAAAPEKGERLYEHFSDHLRKQGVFVANGRFGADMDVQLVNQGPVTVWIEG